MVTIVDYKTYEKEDGSEFHALVVQGGLAAVKSQETGRTYLTAKTARVACTFDGKMCQSLLGTELEGSIIKVIVDPYEYIIPDTGEMVVLSHRYEFVTDLQEDLQEHYIKLEAVA